VSSHQPFAVIGKRDTYHELGPHEMKLVVDTARFVPHSSSIEVVASDGTPIESGLRFWGNKLNCSFNLRDGLPDGVARMDVRLCRRDDGRYVTHPVYFWVIL
jgi:hypothetical protein